MALFGKKEKEPDPNLVCPRCGGPKPASLPLCTTCKMKESADANPYGFPGSQKEKEMRAQGQRFTGTPPPGAPPAGTRASIPTTATVAPAPPLAPSPAPVLAGSEPARGSFADPYAPNKTNFPLRSKQGAWMRSQGERAIADLLFDRGIAFAYEPTVAKYRPTFFLPAAKLVIEVASALTPLPSWQKAEREAAYRGAGYEVLQLDEARALDPAGALATKLPP